MTQADRRRADEDGSASVWVLASGALVVLVALIAVVRGTAVMVRERAEAAADVAALAAAGGIGIDTSTSAICQRAGSVARANRASVGRCIVALGGDGRTGTVDITVVVTARLLGVGTVSSSARARAGRLPWMGDGPTGG